MTDSDGMHFGSAIVGIAVIAVLVGAIYFLTAGSFPPGAQVASVGDEAEIAERLKPVGQVRVAGGSLAPATAPEAPVVAAAPAAAAAGGGDATYNQFCLACHASGVAGAPKLGDKAAWEPRVALGIDALLNTAITGKGAMPPRGTCVACSDDDLKAAIEYMLSKLN